MYSTSRIYSSSSATLSSVRCFKLLPAPSSIGGSLGRHRRTFAQHVDHKLILPFQRPAKFGVATLKPESTAGTISGPQLEASNSADSPEHPHAPRIPSADIDEHAIKEFFRLVLEPSIFREELSSVRASLSPQYGDDHEGSGLANAVIPSLKQLLKEYDAHAGRVLKRVLPSEGTPAPRRRLEFNNQEDNARPGSSTSPSSSLKTVEEDGPIVLVVHMTVNMAEQIEKIAICSGFFIDSSPTHSEDQTLRAPEPILVSCAHTLEEVRIVSLAVLKTTKCAKGTKTGFSRVDASL